MVDMLPSRGAGPVLCQVRGGAVGEKGEEDGFCVKDGEDVVADVEGAGVGRGGGVP